MATLIKMTQDGRKVEVLGTAVCLEGRKEAEVLVPVGEHPNRVAILEAVPDATHVAGRLPLNAEETAVAMAALEQARAARANTPAALAERIRMTQRSALAFRE